MRDRARLVGADEGDRRFGPADHLGGRGRQVDEPAVHARGAIERVDAVVGVLDEDQVAVDRDARRVHRGAEPLRQVDAPELVAEAAFRLPAVDRRRHPFPRLALLLRAARVFRSGGAGAREGEEQDRCGSRE
jgi:hypothetical protein